ncbi:MAG: trypsin-like peptidase domain-containing protein [Firmicutes bacterium]|nr:trypsin-like peptidase domain-containing protein [Bacillota bacterium]
MGPASHVETPPPPAGSLPPDVPTGAPPEPARGGGPRRRAGRTLAWVAFGLACALAGGVGGAWAVLAVWPGAAALGRGPQPVPLISRAGAAEAPAVVVAREVGPAVVGVISQERQTNFWGPAVAASIGTGVAFDRRGYIVTNDHVIAGGNFFQVELPDGQRVPASVVGTDPQTDLAVLKIVPPDSLRVAVFGDSDEVEVGQPVVAIGNPLGLDYQRSVTAGVVSGIRPALYGYTGDEEVSFDPSRQRVTQLIQTDAAINQGNSGGPLVDASGRVIGINTLKGPASSAVEGIGFAIPSNIVKRVVDDLVRYGAVRRAYLGVSFPFVGRDPLTGDPEISLRVSDVVRGGPADAAGMRVGDRVLSFDGHPVRDYIHLLGMLEMHHPGDVVEVVVQRNGAQRTLRVRLAEMGREGQS